MKFVTKSVRETEQAGFFTKHRTWEDLVGIVLGITIILSPWMARQSGDPGVVLVTALLGLVLLTLAQYELVKAHRFVELFELGCGGVLMALPLLLGYAGAGQLRFWHLTLGALVALLALLELWQGFRSAAPNRRSEGSTSDSNPTVPFHGDIH